MGRRSWGRARRTYKCGEPPCIHIVVDERKNLFKIFLEDYDGLIIPIPLEAMQRACSSLKEAEGLREAWGDEIDYLARKYLEAEPKEEIEEE